MKYDRFYYVQATSWHDKKQVCFLHSSEIGCSDGFSVMRYVKEEEQRIKIDGPWAQAEYVKYYNAVDRNDQDSSD